MSTLDEYYRKQLLQQSSECQLTEQLEDGKTFVDSETEVTAAARAATLAALASQEDIVAQKKHLKNTPVLENLVAGTTTPECFKKEYTEEVGKCWLAMVHVGRCQQELLLLCFACALCVELSMVLCDSVCTNAEVSLKVCSYVKISTSFSLIHKTI